MSNNLLHAGILSCFCGLLTFFKKNLSEYYQSVKRFGSRQVLSVLFLVKMFAKVKMPKGKTVK